MESNNVKFMMPDSDRFNISALSNTVLRQGHTLLFCISICTISIRRISVRDNLDFNAEDEGYHECEVNVKVSCFFSQNLNLRTSQGLLFQTNHHLLCPEPGAFQSTGSETPQDDAHAFNQSHIDAGQSHLRSLKNSFE